MKHTCPHCSSTDLVYQNPTDPNSDIILCQGCWKTFDMPEGLFDTDRTKVPYCPWCRHPHNDLHPSEIEEDYTCDSCARNFNANANIRITCTTTRIG